VAVTTAVSTKGMAWVPGGTFAMGSADFYPEERPVRPVAVDGFWIDRHPVTVAQFGRFVGETGYVTVAERPLDPADYPGADPATNFTKSDLLTLYPELATLHLKLPNL